METFDLGKCTLLFFQFCTGSDFPRQRAATQLVGKLYSLCTKASERTRGEVDLFDENAIAYAK